MPFTGPPIIIGGPRTIVGGGAADAVEQASGGAAGFVDRIQSVGDFFAFITDPATLIRGAEAIAGGVLVLVGIYFVFSTTETGQQVIKTTGAAAGSAAKAAVAL